MPERERKQKPAPKERVEETAEVAAPAKQGEELKEELDDLLDEIDSRPRVERRGVRKIIRAERGRMIPYVRCRIGASHPGRTSVRDAA